MATPLSKGTLFPEILIPELINKVRGKSAIAELCSATPIPFNGTKEYTFSMDSEIAVVDESAAKPSATLSLSPIVVKPFKTVYQARVTDEFMYASNELKISIMQSYMDGYSRKLAKGLDLMAFHGVNPATGSAPTTAFASYFDKDITNVVTFGANSSTPDDDVEAAIALIQANYYDPSGIAMAPTMRSALADMKIGANYNQRLYPQMAWGADQSSLNGIQIRVNSTVSSCPVTVVADSKKYTDYAILGDFHSAFRWGYALNPTMEIIEYGDPDQTGVDLKAHNQILLRSETYLGFAVLDKNAFAIIKNAETVQ